jgi:hypothetical protein
MHRLRSIGINTAPRYGSNFNKLVVWDAQLCRVVGYIRLFDTEFTGTTLGNANSVSWNAVRVLSQPWHTVWDPFVVKRLCSIYWSNVATDLCSINPGTWETCFRPSPPIHHATFQVTHQGWWNLGVKGRWRHEPSKIFHAGHAPPYRLT